MQYNHEFHSRMNELTSTLAEYDSAIDPEFDAVYDDLEREFAELRLQISQNA